jgi:hypothetical protein
MAQTFSKTGNDERALDALRRVRSAHDKSIKQGVVDRFFMLQEARYYTLMGDQEVAIDHLEKAADMFMTTAAPLGKFWLEFESLRGHPRFEATQAHMIENLNRERADLGLDAVEI